MYFDAIIFAGYEALAKEMALTPIPWEWHHFPDQESYVRVTGHVPSHVNILCGLNQPDSKLFSLMLLSDALRECGAKHITLIAPYLGYMRQDTRFKSGEALSSHVLGCVLSSTVDHLITVDPHLHRIHSLDEILTIPSSTVHSYALIADYIKIHITNPLLIGPDLESAQWVKTIADLLQAPYVIATKERHGSTDVSVHVPKLSAYTGCHPVLIDDVISSGHTLYQAARSIQHPDLAIVAVHGIFANNAHSLLQSVSSQIVTTNTIPHVTNAISVAHALIEEIWRSRCDSNARPQD